MNNYYGQPNYPMNGNWNNASPLQNLANQYPQAQPVPTPRQTNIPGRVVNTAEEIRPQEIPMDGSVSLFLKQDLSTIYAKAWNSNGQIDTVEYIPRPVPTVPAQGANMSSSNFQNEVFQRLDRLEKMIANQNRQPRYNNNGYNGKKSYTKPQAEVVSESQPKTEESNETGS